MHMQDGQIKQIINGRPTDPVWPAKTVKMPSAKDTTGQHGSTSETPTDVRAAVKALAIGLEARVSKIMTPNGHEKKRRPTF